MSSRSNRTPINTPVSRQLELLKALTNQKQDNLCHFVESLVVAYNWHIINLEKIVTDLNNPRLDNQTHIVLKKEDITIDVFNMHANAESINIKVLGDTEIEPTKSIQEAHAILSRKIGEFYLRKNSSFHK